MFTFVMIKLNYAAVSTVPINGSNIMSGCIDTSQSKFLTANNSDEISKRYHINEFYDIPRNISLGMIVNCLSFDKPITMLVSYRIHFKE